jgi:hypothetical protein
VGLEVKHRHKPQNIQVKVKIIDPNKFIEDSDEIHGQEA